jgi:hypothetical protein
MSADCGKIESAYKDLTLDSNPNDAAGLVEALKEVNESRILKSEVYKHADASAAKMQADGVYTWDIPTGIPGTTSFLNQDKGRPTALELKDAERRETLLFDIGTALPSINTIELSCPGGAIYTSNVFGSGAQPQREFIRVPSGIEIEADPHGQPKFIRRFK